MVVVLIVTMPSLALSLTFNTIGTDSRESKDNSGGADVWAYIGLTGPGDGEIYFKLGYPLDSAK